MTDQAKPISRPWRRLLRFSVRGMIVVVLVIGGWLGWIVRTAPTIQREAVAAIEKPTAPSPTTGSTRAPFKMVCEGHRSSDLTEVPVWPQWLVHDFDPTTSAMLSRSRFLPYSHGKAGAKPRMKFDVNGPRSTVCRADHSRCAVTDAVRS